MGACWLCVACADLQLNSGAGLTGSDSTPAAYVRSYSCRRLAVHPLPSSPCFCCSCHAVFPLTQAAFKTYKHLICQTKCSPPSTGLFNPHFTRVYDTVTQTKGRRRRGSGGQGGDVPLPYFSTEEIYDITTAPLVYPSPCCSTEPVPVPDVCVHIFVRGW